MNDNWQMKNPGKSWENQTNLVTFRIICFIRESWKLFGIFSIYAISFFLPTERAQSPTTNIQTLERERERDGHLYHATWNYGRDSHGLTVEKLHHHVAIPHCTLRKQTQPIWQIISTKNPNLPELICLHMIWGDQNIYYIFVLLKPEDGTSSHIPYGFIFCSQFETWAWLPVQ